MLNKQNLAQNDINNVLIRLNNILKDVKPNLSDKFKIEHLILEIKQLREAIQYILDPNPSKRNLLIIPIIKDDWKTEVTKKWISEGRKSLLPKFGNDPQKIDYYPYEIIEAAIKSQNSFVGEAFPENYDFDPQLNETQINGDTIIARVIVEIPKGYKQEFFDKYQIRTTTLTEDSPRCIKRIRKFFGRKEKLYLIIDTSESEKPSENIVIDN